MSRDAHKHPRRPEGPAFAQWTRTGDWRGFEHYERRGVHVFTGLRHEQGIDQFVVCVSNSMRFAPTEDEIACVVRDFGLTQASRAPWASRIWVGFEMVAE